ncbi:EamA family transporter RarD [Chromatiaceae bacterium AAb-1]|nr:EamA family transporter RarD [Chromatiaceae bacterium AAb-1]
MSLSREQKLGGIFAASAYTLWGLAPLYFKQIDFIAATEILIHRVIWSFLLLFIILFALRQLNNVLQALKQPLLVLTLLCSALLLCANWGVFIWAVNNHHMLDTSLGYYINPLLNIVLGMFFLGERLRPLQWLAVVLAAFGVLVQLILLGSLPWISLFLAGSFAVYGLIRKKLAVDALSGLFIESMLLLPLAVAYWLWLPATATSDLFSNSWQLNSLLIGAGLVTTAPLLCFIAGARRLQLSTMGFFQYIGPSFTFVFGVWLYQEPLQLAKIVTFGFIWLALLVYSYDAWLRSRPLNHKQNV